MKNSWPDPVLKELKLAALLSCGLILCACSPVLPASRAASTPTAIAAANSAPILIGGAMCLTGPIAFADVPALQGVELAVAEVNKAGGVLGRQLEFRNLDCKSDPVAAASAADQIIQQGARAIITSGTYYFGAPAAREAQKAGLVGLSTTASSSLFGSRTLGDKQFTLSMWNNSMGASAAEFAFKTSGWKTAYVLWDTGSDYSISLARYFTTAFTNLGGKVLGEDSFNVAATDYSAQAARIQALPHSPDFVFLSTAMPNTAAVIHTLRGAGMTMPVVGGDSYDDPALFQAAAKEPGSGIFFITHTFLAAGVTPGMAHFLEAYTARYGQPPSSNLVAPGWDAVMVLAQAMQNAGTTDGAPVAKAMESTEFHLLTGKLRWTSAADGHQPDIEGALIQVARGGPRFIGWVQPSAIPAP